MGNTITSVKDNASRSAGSVEGEDGLYAGEKGGNVEGLEEDLGCSVTIRTGIERRFCKEDGMLSKLVSR